ncbi:hypothetical protein DNFV4_01118 [Nitrospira tepida]|uniref:Uncharacterized protein n=2 Tax=Nitrospira tepida TaxID=2973512 RepID=A0AA86MX43_9BACT|nr:hypothetical protein DNFV4_01118 [Nitrospira tepida]
MVTASQWYSEFYKAYYKDGKIQALENKTKLTDSQWTDGFREFLRRLAGSLGYEVVTEHKAHGGQRFDQTWSKPGETIAIEYENDYTTILSEVKKLCSTNSRLRVLITYCPERNFLSEILNIAQHTIAPEIDKRLGDFSGEFLLIAGGYEWNDWSAIRMVLKAQLDPIRL